MMNLSKMAVSKPTTVLLIFIILTALGIYSTFSLPIDLLPDMDLPYMAIMTTYPNAGPEEVERSVTRVIESSVSSVTGIENMISYSSSGSSTILLEFGFGVNLDEASNQARDRLDMIKNYLPEEAESPLIVKMDPSMMPIMAIAITANRTPEELRTIAEDTIQPRLEQLEGVASAPIAGGREKAVIVDIPRNRLEAYSLTISQISQMIGVQNIQSGGGTISEGDLNYTISTSGEYSSIDDIKNTVIAWKTETPVSMTGSPAVRKILLRDIADVYEGYKPETTLAFHNGEPCVSISIQKQSGKNSVETARRVNERIEKLNDELPSDIRIETVFDTTDMIESSINEVVNSAVQGAILAVIVLLVFLRSIRSTLIISITIPVSLVVTLGLMYFCGFTLNIMTLAGLALGVGMLVDNSIVVLENIYKYRENGAKSLTASVLGAQEMIMAITSSTLTTICVFLPLIMYKNELGILGQVFQGLVFTVVFSLLCSLLVAVVLVPVLSSKYLKLNPKNRVRSGFLGKVNNALQNIFDGMDNGYAYLIGKILNHKKLTLVLLLVLFVVSICLIPVIGFVYMPSQAENTVSLSITTPVGTRLEVTQEVVSRFEAIAKQEVKGIESLLATVGSSSSMMSSNSENSGQIQITLEDFKPGNDTAEEIKEKFRKHFDDFPGVTFAFSSTGASLGGGGITISVKSEDLELCRNTANSIKTALEEKGKDYVTEVQVDYTEGLPQVDIVIDRQKLYDYGLNIYTVSSEIKGCMNGLTASRYRSGGNEIDIVVQLAEGDREKISDLSTIFVTNSAGKRIPLASFASWQEGYSPVSIKRENQSRIVNVTATAKLGVSLGKVQSEIERIVRESIPTDENVVIEYSGDYEEFMEGISKFLVIIFMAIILVFAVMASQFESFLDPFIVIFTIPLSVIGVVLINLLMGTTLNMITAVGLLVLVGVIVNNGIVLVDYTNLLRKRGYGLREACIEAGRSRLRPVLMTTLTTILGLVPMTFFPGEGGEMSQPIGQTILGGLSFGTLMTLFLMPVLYYIFNNYRDKKAAKKAEKKRLSLEKIKAEGGAV